MKKDLMIVFEGTDFAGKTYLIEEVRKLFQKEYQTYSVNTWREPYYCRSLSGSEWVETNVDPIANALEYIIRRRFLVRDIEKNNKKSENKININLVDRGVLSTLVHNMKTLPNAIKAIELHKELCKDYKPDLIVVLQPTMLQLAKNTVRRLKNGGYVDKKDEIDFQKNYEISNQFSKAAELWQNWRKAGATLYIMGDEVTNEYLSDTAEAVVNFIKKELLNETQE